MAALCRQSATPLWEKVDAVTRVSKGAGIELAIASNLFDGGNDAANLCNLIGQLSSG
jgi:hypothetical protein